MFDRNPSDENAIFSDADLKNTEIVEMKLLRDGDFGFWACPVCMTDDYLADHYFNRRDYCSAVPG